MEKIYTQQQLDELMASAYLRSLEDQHYLLSQKITEERKRLYPDGLPNFENGKVVGITPW